MADNLDAFSNGDGQSVDRGLDETERIGDGYETLNNVAGWQIPEGAIRTENLRNAVIHLVAQGIDDPRDLATLTLPGLVAAIGELEARLIEQDARIASVQDAMIALLHQIAGEN